MQRYPHDTATGGAAPAGHALTYQPALDGIRALAIVAVLLYHGGVPWAEGGFLGVEAFFVLSGYLITSLLVEEWASRGSIRLGRFWARRARRLLPALFCLVIVIGVHQALAGASNSVPGLLGDGLATLFYVGNWHQIATGAGYFAQTARPSPLQHTWSLAIEEQFYVIWPLVVLGLLRLTGPAGGPAGGPSARRRGLAALLGVAAAGSVASALEMAVLFHGGAGVTRVYYGTDTRAQSILAGAALACALARRRHRAETAGDRRRPMVGVALGGLGVAGMAGVLLGMHLAAASGGRGGDLYRGGFLAFDLANVALIASVVLVPRTPLGRLLASWPLRSVGQISYGLYLWHYPLFLWLDEQSTGLSGGELLALRFAATLAVSLVSYFAIEQPIRQRRWPALLVRASALPSLGAAVAALVVASSVPVAAVPSQARRLPGVTRTMPSPAASISWTGDERPCRVPLYATYPASGTFRTCPPVRVMLMGDSMAVTLGLGMAAEQERYGVLLDNAAVIGCSFGVRGLGEWSGEGFFSQFAPCLTQFAAWRRLEGSIHPQALVVLMGYWDCFDREWNGRDVHIGESAFDAYLFARMEQFVRTEGAGGIPVVVLTVPWVNPAPFANGSPPPAATPLRHALVNEMLAKLASTFPAQVHLVDLDGIVSPGDHFDATVNGHPCRTNDGIHFEPYCGALVATQVFPLVRRLVEQQGGPGPSGAPGPG